MPLGEFQIISLGHQKKEFDNTHRYRNMLAAVLRTDPKKLFEMPGDINYEALEKLKYITPDKIEAWLSKQGNDVKLIHKIADA